MLETCGRPAEAAELEEGRTLPVIFRFSSIAPRRDVRRFRPDAVPGEVLERVLAADALGAGQPPHRLGLRV